MKDKSIEDKVVEKIFKIVNLLLMFKIKPDIKIREITELNEKEIDRIKKLYEIEGVILDVDETIRFDMRDVPKPNQEWIDMIKKKLKVIVVSNGVDKKMEDFFESKGIDYIGFAHKPLKKNFIKACNKMKLKPEQVAIIGDDLFSDIYGGKRNSMTTIMVLNNNDKLTKEKSTEIEL